VVVRVLGQARLCGRLHLQHALHVVLRDDRDGSPWKSNAATGTMQHTWPTSSRGSAHAVDVIGTVLGQGVVDDEADARDVQAT
jgi:hypothetical protein